MPPVTPTPEQRAAEIVDAMRWVPVEDDYRDLLLAIASAIRAAESAAAAEAVEEVRPHFAAMVGTHGEECHRMNEEDGGCDSVRRARECLRRIDALIASRSTPAPKESADD